MDVDCISDGEVSVIGAIMQHIEEAGIHSGDSAEGRPHVIDMIKNDEIDLIINTPSGQDSKKGRSQNSKHRCRAPYSDPHHNQWG